MSHWIIRGPRVELWELKGILECRYSVMGVRTRVADDDIHNHTQEYGVMDMDMVMYDGDGWSGDEAGGVGVVDVVVEPGACG